MVREYDNNNWSNHELLKIIIQLKKEGRYRINFYSKYYPYYLSRNREMVITFQFHSCQMVSHRWEINKKNKRLLLNTNSLGFIDLSDDRESRNKVPQTKRDREE